MERKTISKHEAQVYKLLGDRPDDWFTNKDIASTVGFAERTVRMHTMRLTRIGIFEQEPVFPAYRYRLSPNWKKHPDYIKRLERALDALGL